jgi:hypothetical protein
MNIDVIEFYNKTSSGCSKTPVLFFITDHYKDYPLMLIDLTRVKKKDLKQLLITSWQLRAPKSLQRQLRKQ